MSKRQIREHYDSVARTWRDKVWVNDADLNETVKAFANLSEMSRLLDVGIGAGDFSSLFTAASVTGIDLSVAHLIECRKLRPHVHISLADAEQMPFINEQFDAVCARNVLQNFVSPAPVVHEMLRVLRSGGTLILVESAVYDYERQFPTAVCRVVEPCHPLFPSHEFLLRLFAKVPGVCVTQEVATLCKRWLRQWQRSKGATDSQTKTIYHICQAYPDWYKRKYSFTFFSDETEIESCLTFSLLRIIKLRCDPFCSATLSNKYRVL